MGLLVRPEAERDFDAIDAVVAAAFGRDAEARLVRAIRASPEYVPDLALVAEEDGRVVGHVMLSYARLRGDRDHRVLALAPVSVAPERQRSGIGIALVRAALERADSRGDGLVVVLGHAEYYPKFGFQSARRLGVEPPSEDIPDDVFMALRLSGYDPSMRGRIEYPPAFAEA
jgi:putative acetyltransferase